MDIESPCRGDSKDLIREKLIAISECMPDNDPADSDSTLAPEVFKASNGIVKNRDATEKLISDLISISYDESPDNEITTPKSDARPNGKP